MATRLLAIRQACSLEPDLRTEENVDDILEFVKDVQFFSKLSLVQQRTLCRTMEIEEFGSRVNVFEIGDPGSKFYIILSGSVGVQIPSQSAPCPSGTHTENCNCPGRPLDTVVILEPRTGFGELALQSELPRSATIQACEDTELLVIEKKHYQKHAGQLHRQFVEQRIDFLRGCPRIEEALQQMLVSKQDIGLMANCLQEKSVNGNGVACRQGDPVDQIIFVRSGSLAIIRVVDADATSSGQRDQPQDISGACSPSASPRRKTTDPEPTTGAAAAGRNSSVRPGMKIGASYPDDREPSGEEEEPATLQTEKHLAKNLARLMRDMKKKEREEKIDDLVEKGIITEHDRDWEASGTMANDGTVTIANVKANNVKRKVTLQVDTGKGEAEAKQSPGGGLWKRVSKAVGLASNQNRFLAMMGGLEGAAATIASEETAEKNVEAAQRSIEHLSSVSRARKRYDEVRFKDMQGTSLKSQVQTPRRGSRLGTSKGSVERKKRKLLLRVGTLGPNQFFGDQQICSTETYSATLVSDPVAEIYVISKHDIIRRLPKKLFSALFAPEKEQRATDAQLLDMHRQVERWGAFRKAMHGEALSQVGLRNPGMSVHRPLRDPCSSARIDPLANLDFLGVHPRSALGQHLAQTPRMRGSAGLTAKDEELFSQASAGFLRRVDIITRDPGLHSALAKTGQHREVAEDRGHEGGRGLEDPMSFRFEQHWAKLRKDQIGLDLDNALEDEPAPLTRGRLSARMSVSRPRASLAVASPRLAVSLAVASPESLPRGRLDVFGSATEVPEAPQSARVRRADGQDSFQLRPLLSTSETLRPLLSTGQKSGGWTSTSGSHGRRKATASLPARHHGRHVPVAGSPPEPSGARPNFMRRYLP